MVPPCLLALVLSSAATLPRAARVEDFDVGEAPLLTVLASTHNAAGKAKESYDAGAWRALLDPLLPKEKSELPDVVLFALQEMKGVRELASELQSRGIARECHAAKHSGRTGCPKVFGSLGLVACTTLDSPWRATAESELDVKHEHKAFECSKGTTGLVLDLQAPDREKVRLCALSTHQNYAAPASTRMKDWSKAMTAVGTHGCDATVFMGDFNSRLHCLGSKPSFSDKAPLFAASSPDKNDFQFLLDTVCGHKSACPYGEEAAKYDELADFMAERQLSCFEKGGKKKDWILETFKNEVMDYGYREAATPTFGPTYKLASTAAEGREGGEEEEGCDEGSGCRKRTRSGKPVEGPPWRHCLDGLVEHDCLVNKKRAPANNPAWTDRILLREAAGVELKTQSYRRVVVPETDHASVQAELSLWKS